MKEKSELKTHKLSLCPKLYYPFCFPNNLICIEKKEAPVVCHSIVTKSPGRKTGREASLAAVAGKDGVLPLHFLYSLLGVGAATRGLCWEYLNKHSLQPCHQAQWVCHSGGHSSVAWSIKRNTAGLAERLPTLSNRRKAMQWNTSLQPTPKNVHLSWRSRLLYWVT